MSTQKKNKRWILPAIIATGFIGLFAWGLSSTDTGKQIKAYVAEKLNIKDFRNRFLPFAQQNERNTGVPALYTLARSAHESNWGKSAPGFNFFGFKIGSSWTGARQLLRTWEILTDKEHQAEQRKKSFPEILNVEKTADGWKYTIRDYFRSYPSPLESFADHAASLKRISRYKNAFNYKDPHQFADEIIKAGYSKDPNVGKAIHKYITDFQNLTT